MQTALLQRSILGRGLLCKQQTSARPARCSSVVRAAGGDRPKWYPGAEPPAHLNGERAGDYGFDPLRLGADQGRFEWFREAETVNARWAMAAVAGILFTELLGIGQPWWTQPLQARYPLPLQIGLPLTIGIFAVIEGTRYKNWKKSGAGNSGLLGSAPFDPLGLNSDQMRVKEIKNGRLAMIAFIGFCSQAAVQGKGPIESLNYHIADPYNRNIFTSDVGREFAVACVALSFWPILQEGAKYDSKDKEARGGSPFGSSKN